MLANGSMSSNTSNEGEIRKNIIEADLVDCMVALPGQLFYSTQIPVCLWFLARGKTGGAAGRGAADQDDAGHAGRGASRSALTGTALTGTATTFRDRRGEVLFIDARKLGEMEDRTHRRLTDEDIGRIADTYHAWRGEEDTIERAGEYEDMPGFCKSATLEEVRKHGHVLTPGRYVGAEAAEEDAEPFEEKMRRLTATLNEQFAESARLEKEIRANLRSVGYHVGEEG